MQPQDRRSKKRRAREGACREKAFLCANSVVLGVCGEIARENAHHGGTEIAQRTTETNSPTDSEAGGSRFVERIIGGFRSYRALRALGFFRFVNLGFRFAPPQALWFHRSAGLA